MLRSYIQRRERYLAMLNDDRVVRPFAWGSEFIGQNGDGKHPGEALKKYAAAAVKNSEEFFHLPAIADFALQDGLLTWTSSISTPTPENNTARAHFFPAGEKRAAVVVLPHWNAKKGSYEDLCRVFNRVGLSALRLTLPYHEERRESEDARADHIVSANIGRTIESMRQAVVDTRAAVRFLKEQGYERIGVAGTSIGSCIGFLAMVHDENIDTAVFNHVSGYVADVVWRGLSTYHVKEGLEERVTLEDLREYWSPVSPLAYLDKLKTLPPRPMKFIYTLYDLTFPHDLSLQVRDEMTKAGIKADFSWLPCGHYTLGEKPWVYLDGFKIVSFLRRNLK
jgi:dienelactone hydrolase